MFWDTDGMQIQGRQIIMKRYNILVTGVGAIIGYGIIKCLRKSKYDCHITGMDIYEDAVGQAWADEFIQAVPASDYSYSKFLRTIIERKNIDLVFFGTEQEIAKVLNSEEDLGEFYGRLVLNRKETILLSGDKWEMYKFLGDHKFPLIPTSIEKDYQTVILTLGSPFLIKPRHSYAGKGIVKVASEEEFEFYKKHIESDNYMVQKMIGDDEHEYTAAAFGFGDGTGNRPIILRRKLSQEGATTKAWVVEDDELEEQIICLMRLLKPIGPTNFQFRKENGVYFLLEINARISSSTSMRRFFGFNEAQMCIQWYVEHKRIEERAFRKGRAVRYIEDWVEVK